MKAGSMEGLINANINMKLSQTPMRVYKEAERRGDTEVMKRALGYVTDFQENAQKSSDKAQEELTKELKEERKEQKIRRQQALEQKQEEKEYAEKIQEKNKLAHTETDYIEVSEEGKEILKNNLQIEKQALVMENVDIKMYTSDGKPISIESDMKFNNKKVDIRV